MSQSTVKVIVSYIDELTADENAHLARVFLQLLTDDQFLAVVKPILEERGLE